MTQPKTDPREQTLEESLRAIRPERFGFAEARHLLWRAGFGGTPRQIQALADMGPEGAVDALLEYDDIPVDAPVADAFDRDIMRPYSEAERTRINQARRRNDEDTVQRFRAMRQTRQREDRRQVREVQLWWLKRMIETPRPLEEKMTLFWHGHFATSYRTIEDSYHMYVQNQLLRQHATGNFADLMYGIIRDPAMIAYLDNNDSRKDQPNENLARELMELFGLGEGNYSERDIKEGARALTGYTFRDDEFVFNERNHDNNPKRILGRSGRLDGDDFVTAILERRDCARFISEKLYRFFVLDASTGRPDIDRAVTRAQRELSNSLLRNKYAIRPTLRRLFLSEHFYSPVVMSEHIKSPAELAVGAVRSLLTPTRDTAVILDAMNLMGQNLFFPPSVAGWAGGRSWINTSTMFVRQNLLCFLLTGKMPTRDHALADREPYDPSFLFDEMARAAPGSERDPSRAAEYLLRLTLGHDSARNRETLVAFVDAHGGRLTPDITTGLLLLITAMPEYQLC